MSSILIADDKKGMRDVLAEALSQAGHDVKVVGDGDEASRAIDNGGLDLVVTDLRMPGCDGIEVLRKASAKPSPPVVIVMTAYGSVDTAVEAMRLGAVDFVTKPFGLAEMEAKITRALAGRTLREENERLRGDMRLRLGSRLIGESAAMHAVRSAIAKVAAAPMPVLVTGESGTGKELVAREIHDQSARRAGPFVPVNCAALAESLLESELFGHEKGAFTGAVGVKRGKLELSGSGTLFLDEIGEIAPSVQVKLLRFLQEKEIERVGGEERLKVDARVIAATNRDLPAAIGAGRFREDLYYRLNVVHIALPPLRDRIEDLPLLVDAIIERVAKEIARPVSISAEARKRLPAWRWPGNVRELENVLARAAILCEGNVIEPHDLRLDPPSETKRAGSTFVDAPDLGLDERVEAFERALLVAALDAEGGNQSRAAERLKIKRSTLQYKMAKLGIAAKAE